MGFNASDLKFLLSGMPGKSICTLGRLNLFISQSELDRTLRECKRPALRLPDRAILFAEDVLEPLGYEVFSMDASSYENASIIHDLNEPVPNSLVERFDIVWDGGTLEHIFNFPVALTNALKMVKVGGSFAARTPANNQCGHGFYQFSPELFYRTLMPGNGYNLHRLHVASRGKNYHVRDPANAGSRVELLDGVPAMLVVHAKKVSSVPDRISIQQSDYVTAWSEETSQDGRLKSLLRKRLSPETVTKISAILNRMRQRQTVFLWKRRSRLSNRAFYRQVINWDEKTSDAFR